MGPIQSPTDRFYAELDKAVDADKNLGKTNNIQSTEPKITTKTPERELTEFQGKSIREKINDIATMSMHMKDPGSTDGASLIPIPTNPEGREVRTAVHDLIKQTSKDHVGVDFLPSQVKILESGKFGGGMARLMSKGEGSIKANDTYKLDIDRNDKSKMGDTEKTYHSFLDNLFGQLHAIKYQNPSDLR